jgi:hypothetical protein
MFSNNNNMLNLYSRAMVKELDEHPSSTVLAQQVRAREGTLHLPFKIQLKQFSLVHMQSLYVYNLSTKPAYIVGHLAVPGGGPSNSIHPRAACLATA